MARTFNDSDDTVRMIYGITNLTDRTGKEPSITFYACYLYFVINKVALDICSGYPCFSELRCNYQLPIQFSESCFEIVMLLNSVQ